MSLFKMGCSPSSAKVAQTILETFPNDELSVESSDGSNNYDDFPSFGNYFNFKQIWRGANANVFVGRGKEDKKKYAIKVYFDNPKKIRFGEINDLSEIIENETQILYSLSHENCSKLIDSIKNEEEHLIIHVFDFIPFTLTKLVENNKLDEEHTRFIFKQVADGIHYLHTNGILHRDLKPDNIMINKNYHATIIDFSSATRIVDGCATVDDTVGSPIFCSPEIQTGEPYDGMKADVWAFGVSLYFSIFGKLPFSNDDTLGTYFEQCAKISKHIIEDEVDYNKNPPISPTLLDLFKHILDKNPETRYSIEEVLNHKWFK